jgi:rare lipoprotein A
VIPDLDRRHGLLRRITGFRAMLALLVLAGCASAPRQAGETARSTPAAVPGDARDGSEAQPPSGLAQVPDAEPRIEAIRSGGPNKPYEALGGAYVPITDDRPFVERGLASWYGRKFHGRRTASGEPFDMYAMTAAHPTLPIPSYARVRNPANGREVVVRINDRGPFHPGRIVDLSYTAALRLDVLRGVAPVELARITADEIRSGAWRRADRATPAAPLIVER